MNILYLHGFGSKYQPGNEKVKALKQLGEVKGPNIDYTQGFDVCMAQVINFIVEENYEVDLIVGTSLGGHMASHVGRQLVIPFVAINPSVEPPLTLKRYKGIGTDFTGRTYNFTEENIKNYPIINMNGCGLVLLEMGDELIDANRTKNLLKPYYQIDCEEGGNHRYAGLINKLELIKEFYNDSGVVYGFGI